jgi:hypothetical protein
MIMYSHDEIQEFLKSLQQWVHPPSTKRTYSLMVDREIRSIETTVLEAVMTSSKPINYRTLNLGGLRYVSPLTNWMPIYELKELYDIAFRLEFERVPMIIHDFPEVAVWRLRIGK